MPYLRSIDLFIRPHLEYGDILYDKPDNENVQNKIEKVQYTACLAIAGAIQEIKPFKKYFFPYCINAWNNLKADIWNAKSISIFKKLIASKRRGNSLFSVHDPLGEKFLTRLRLDFSHLKEHKFRHGFADTINPMCACRADVETTEHFLFVVTFIQPKGLNSSIILRQLPQTSKI